MMNWTILQWVLLLASAGQIQSHALRFTILEEQEAGIKIGSLSRNYSAPYQLFDEYIRVDESTGDLFTKKRIDRETLCPSHQDRDCTFSNTAVVSHSEFVLITIVVDDINDNAPIFERDEIHIRIPEDASNGTGFPLDDQAHDKDFANNGLIHYHLEGSDGFFGIRQDGYELELVVQRKLDRETQENHFLVLVAVDGGSVPLSATAILNVTVTDVNDNCPEFDADSPITAIVPGLGIKGTAVAQLKATDKDLGQNAQITFSFSRQISDRAKTLFHMDGNTGLISLAVDVQVDSPEEHVLKVFANSPLCPPAQTQVTIYIQPVTSPEPTIKIRFVAENKNQVIVLQENEPPTVLALLELEDTSSDKGTLSLEADSMPFSLKPKAGSYLLLTSKPLDFEMCSEYDVTVVISDPHGTRLHGRKVIKVVVEDVNDNAPMFDQTHYEKDIKENNIPGVFLLKVQATDADSHQFGKVRYRLTNGGPFIIHEETGVISVAESLDREQQDRYQLTVLARDGGDPSQEGSAIVSINVLDLNDNPPAFSTPHFYFFVSESLPRLSQVGKVTVSDTDEGDNGKIVDVRILNEKVPFAIDLAQGLIRSTGEVDREKQDRYELLVVATDAGRPALSTTVKMTVFVEDVNDNQPKVLLPSSNLSCQTISPATRAGSMITKIYAIDEDSGMNSDITYQIVASEPALHSPFQIDQHSGNITLVQHLRNEDYGMHHLFVVIRDGGKPDPLQTTVWVNLLVNETREKCHVNAVPEYLPATLPPPMPLKDCRGESNAWLVFFLSGLALMLISGCVLLTVVVMIMKHKHTKRKVKKKNAWETGNLCELKPLN
ncbi:hypothetical protein ABG768_006740 [Culter alburnus]|uniref:Protocadherin-20 n=1 Tax=Culter alburnus TaxID=194366 RepID=A0AAW1ZRF3_CULAL